jgi:hypothetical protein
VTGAGAPRGDGREVYSPMDMAERTESFDLAALLA